MRSVFIMLILCEISVTRVIFFHFIGSAYFNLFEYYHQVRLGTCETSMMKFFFKTPWQLLVVDYFCKKVYHGCLTRPKICLWWYVLLTNAFKKLHYHASRVKLWDNSKLKYSKSDVCIFLRRWYVCNIFF